MHKRLRRTTCAGRTTSGTCTWRRPSRLGPSPHSSARFACGRPISRRWYGSAGCTSIRASPRWPSRCSHKRSRFSLVWSRRSFGLGRAALAKREYSRAVDQFEQVLAADPRASIAHYPLALAYRGLSDTARAEAHLRQQGTVEVGPPDPLMVELRGLLHGAVAEEGRGIRGSTAATSRRRPRFSVRASNWRRTTRHFGTNWERRCR